MKVKPLIKYFAGLLFCLFCLILISIVALSLEKPPKASMEELYQPNDWLKTWLVFIPAIVFLYTPMPKVKKIKLIISLGLLILTGIFVIEEFSRQTPTVDIFKWGSVIILSYNVFSFSGG